METLPGLWSLSPFPALLGVIVVFFILLATGKIITKSSHERELAQANKRGDEWKETAMDLRAVNAEIRRQNALLLDGSRTASEFFSKTTPSIEDTGVPGVGS